MKDRKRALRKKHILHLMESFLIDNGYRETAQCLRSEAKLTRDYVVCDNINLEAVVIEFETFYHHRFQTYPQFCKRIEPTDTTPSPATRSPAKKSIKKLHQLKQPGEKNLFVRGEECASKGACFTSEMEESRWPENGSEFNEVIRDVCIEPPATYWEEIIGLDDAKETLKEAIVYPIKYPHLFGGCIEPWKGILLYGPPGTGKTSLARAVATESTATFYNITASSIVNKWRGETEKILKVLFETAQNNAPSIIFIDEIDSLTLRRSVHEHEASRRMKSEIFAGLDTIGKSKNHVFFLATTNTPWDLDDAILRRFEKIIYIPPPNLPSRVALLRRYLPKTISYDPAIECDLNYDDLAQAVERFSGSDIRNLSKNLKLNAMRDVFRELERNKTRLAKTKITDDDFRRILSQCKSTVEHGLEKYQKWESQRR